MKSNYSPFFTEKFFTKPLNPFKEGDLNFVPFPYPLPSDIYNMSGSDLQHFLLSEEGQSFKKGVAEIAEKLHSWCENNNISTQVEMETEVDGKRVKVTRNVIQDCLLNEKFSDKNPQGTVAYPLYTEGVVLLHKIIQLLPNEKIDLTKKKNIVKKLIKAFPYCPPRVHSDSFKAYSAFFVDIDFFIMKIKKLAVSQVVLLDVLVRGQYHPGNEIHNVNGILDEIQDEIGVLPSNDKFANKPTPEEVVITRQSLPNVLTVEFCIDWMIKKITPKIDLLTKNFTAAFEIPEQASRALEILNEIEKIIKTQEKNVEGESKLNLLREEFILIVTKLPYAEDLNLDVRSLLNFFTSSMLSYIEDQSESNLNEVLDVLEKFKPILTPFSYNPEHLSQAKLQIEEFESFLNQYGEDDQWLSNYIADEDDDVEYKYRLNGDLVSQLHISFLRRLSNLNFLQFNEFGIQVSDKRMIKFVPDHSIKFGYVLDKVYGKWVKKPLLPTLIREYLAGQSSLIEKMTESVNSFCTIKEGQGPIYCLFILLQEELKLLREAQPPISPRMAEGIIAEWMDTLALNSTKLSCVPSVVEKQFLQTAKRWPNNTFKTSPEFISLVIEKGDVRPFELLPLISDNERKAWLLDSLGIECLMEQMLKTAKRKSLYTQVFCELLQSLPNNHRKDLIITLIEQASFFFQHIPQSIMDLTEILHKVPNNDLIDVINKLNASYLQAFSLKDLCLLLDTLSVNACPHLINKVTRLHLISETINSPKYILKLLNYFDHDKKLEFIKDIITQAALVKIKPESVIDCRLLVKLMKALPQKDRYPLLQFLKVESFKNLPPIAIYGIILSLPPNLRLVWLKNKEIAQAMESYPFILKTLALFEPEHQQILLDVIGTTIEDIKQSLHLTSGIALMKTLDEFCNDILSLLRLLDADYILVDTFDCLHEIVNSRLKQSDSFVYLNDWPMDKMKLLVTNGNNLFSLIENLTDAHKNTFLQKFSKALSDKELEQYKDNEFIYNLLRFSRSDVSWNFKIFKRSGPDSNHDQDKQDGPSFKQQKLI